MRSIGRQVADYRATHKLSPKEMAERVGTKRQNIEQLESVGNRKPQYIGKLARVMGVTVDEMLIEAGLIDSPPPVAKSPPAGPLTDRLRQEQEEDPYELIERGLRALIVVGRAKQEVLDTVRKYADIAAETQRALDERFRTTEK